MNSRTQTKPPVRFPQLRMTQLTCPLLAALFFATAAHSTPLFAVQGSVRQFFIIGAPPGARAYLFSPKNGPVRTGITDELLGGLIFREVEPGDGYIAAVRYQGQFTFSDPTTVLSETFLPPQSFYEQPLPTGLYGHSGYGYIVTRDGTQLSVQVQLPDDSGGPFPTLIEYSGYSPSDPTPDDLVHQQVQPFRLIAGLLNYAYVGVNIRGTGCSGGAFDYFELLQSLDGYDIVETVAAQPWAASVGMFGISYAGISQLFVAQTRPPHLAAISPLSPIDDTFRGTLYPGGIFNDGFALSWAMERQDQNRWPDPIGADWVVDRIYGKPQDAQCLTNQLLRQQNPNLLEKIERNPFYPAVGNPDYPEGGDVLSPYAFVRRINVPTYIAGAWQDDQTGGHWPVMLDQFDCSTYVRVSATNGTHVDSLGPYQVRALGEFLDLYVAHRVPSISDVARFFAMQLYSGIFGVDGVRVPDDRPLGATYEEARAAFESEDRIHIYWETGAKPGATPGSPEWAAESSYSRWPPQETQPVRLYFQTEGRLDSAPPDIDDEDPRGVDSYVYDPTAKPGGDFRCPNGEEDPNKCRDEIWKANATYDWRPLPPGKALAFVSDPLPSQMTMLGSGSVDLWLQSMALDTDIEVTLTEVRPDGQERYIQNGWLRASHRRLDEGRSTELRPRHTHLQADAQTLPPGQFVPLRVELLPFAYVFRPESRIRISVETPGGNRPLWTFNVLPLGKDTVNSIAHSRNRPSSVVLPLIPDVTVPSEYPACPIPGRGSVRSEPCRDYVPGAPRAR